MVSTSVSKMMSFLETEQRKYRYDLYGDDVIKVFNYVEPELKLLNFAQNEGATVSDTFILYAIAMLGAADANSIQLFLRNVKKRHPELNIADMSDDRALLSRLAALRKLGYVFSIKASYGNGSRGILKEVSFHFLTSDAVALVNRKLTRRLNPENWLVAMPLNQIVEWGACSYVGTVISHHSNYVEYLDGNFQSKLLGKYLFPSEIRFNDGEKDHYVAVIGSYLYKNESTQTDRDFLRVKIDKINAIRNYLCIRAPKANAVAEVVIVVDTESDFLQMLETFSKAGTLTEFLPRIYFTGEGILRHTDYFEDSFFSLEYDGENYTPVKSVPMFLKKA